MRSVIYKFVGRERRERVSQLAWCGEGCFDSRGRVNSNVRALFLNGNTHSKLGGTVAWSRRQKLRGFSFVSLSGFFRGVRNVRRAASLATNKTALPSTGARTNR